MRLGVWLLASRTSCIVQWPGNIVTSVTQPVPVPELSSSHQDMSSRTPILWESETSSTYRTLTSFESCFTMFACRMKACQHAVEKAAGKEGEDGKEDGGDTSQ
jgi:hypothetical protein